ncbi:hypothetical protein SISSUDRAFT_1067496 [Sistotremastrum suecicum HHB10207 ss-3]|uniref:Uncharacterized protein n=1 Tax=Sistotremastrum suecicum HHB10207 ss-3 TaxID=1314776 RepID=A0A165X1W9_9AGAM|nr:hypothetical protein SISSUDRAFT_1067496 [Sistotremastrum suecicum HHB10207 ss-3]
MSSPSSFPQTYGAILIGVIISTFLSGINTSQVIYYFSQYPGDPRRLKITVFATWLFDVIQAGLLGHAMYYYFVLNFFNPTVLSDGVWSLYLDVVITFKRIVLSLGMRECHTLFRELSELGQSVVRQTTGLQFAAKYAGYSDHIPQHVEVEDLSGKGGLDKWSVMHSQA